MNENHLQINNICKSYGSAKVLDDISLDFFGGEIHAVLGENACGKSTLIKVISGMVKEDGGSVVYNGRALELSDRKKYSLFPAETVYQEVCLFNDLTVLENIYFKHFDNYVDYKKLSRQYEEDRKLLHLSCDKNERVGHVSLGQKRLIEITKAMVSHPEVLLLDEPIESFTQIEVEHLKKRMSELKQNGKIVIVVTHKLEQVFAMCDKVSILHDSRLVETINVKDTDEQSLLMMMAGKEYKYRYPRVMREKGMPMLRAEHITGKYVSDISFTLYQREILGITGLVGSGKTNIGKLIFGLSQKQSGKVFVKQKEVTHLNPETMLKHGCGYLVEENIRNLIPYLDAPYNITLSNLNRVKRGFLIHKTLENGIYKYYKKRFAMTLTNPWVPVKRLSGGTQQKVALAKLLNTDVDVMLLDEPTKGLDSASKSDLYNFMNEYVAKNKSILLISSDFAEAAGMCDRVIVLKDGYISCILYKDDLTKANIVRSAVKEKKL